MRRCKSSPTWHHGVTSADAFVPVLVDVATGDEYRVDAWSQVPTNVVNGLDTWTMLRLVDCAGGVKHVLSHEMRDGWVAIGVEVDAQQDDRMVPLAAVRQLVDEWVKRAEQSEHVTDRLPELPPSTREYHGERARVARSYAATLEVVAKSSVGIPAVVGGPWETRKSECCPDVYGAQGGGLMDKCHAADRARN